MLWKFFIGLVASFFIVIPVAHAQGVFTKDLKYGSKGDAVIELQEFLTDEELYTGPISGSFYSLTRTAVRKFQKREKIKQTGLWDKKTRERADAILASEIEEDGEEAPALPSQKQESSKPKQDIKQDIVDWWKSLFAPRPVETPAAPARIKEQPIPGASSTTTAPVPWNSTTTGTPFVVTSTPVSPILDVPVTQPIVVSPAPSSTSSAPAITVSDIAVTNITTSSVTITWRTSEAVRALDQAVVFWIYPDHKYSVAPSGSGTSFSTLVRLPTGEPLISDANYTFVVRYPDRGVWKDTYPDFFHTLANVADNKSFVKLPAPTSVTWEWLGGGGIMGSSGFSYSALITAPLRATPDGRQTFSVYVKDPPNSSYTRYSFTAKPQVKLANNMGWWNYNMVGSLPNTSEYVGEYRFYAAEVDERGVLEGEGMPTEVQSVRMYAAPTIVSPAPGSSIVSLLSIEFDNTMPTDSLRVYLYRNSDSPNTGTYIWTGGGKSGTAYNGPALSASGNPYRIIVWGLSNSGDKTLIANSTFTIQSATSTASSGVGFWHRVVQFFYKVVALPARIIVKIQSQSARATATSTATSTPSATADAPPIISAFVKSASQQHPDTIYAGLRAYISVTITDDYGLTSGKFNLPGMKYSSADVAISGCNNGAKSCSEPVYVIVPSTSGSHTVTFTATDTAGQTSTQTITFTATSCSADSECGTLVWAGATYCGSTGNPETKVMKYADSGVCSAGVCNVTNGPNVFEDCAGSGKMCGFNLLAGGTFKCVTPPGVDCRLDAAITTACKCNTVSYENYGYCCSPFQGQGSPYHSPSACPLPEVVTSPTPTSTPTNQPQQSIPNSTNSTLQTSCGSITSGGGIKAGIYLISGRTSEIYGRTDCLADSEQQIQWVTCVEALSGTMFYPQRDNFTYSYMVKNPSGTVIDSGNWTPSWITSMSSCPSNNGSGNDYTVAYNIQNLQPGTPYTFTLGGTNASGSFSSTATFKTKSSTLIPTPISIPTSTSTPLFPSTPTPAAVPVTTTPFWVPTYSTTTPASFVPPSAIVTTTPFQGPPQPLTRTQLKELEQQKKAIVRELKTMERYYLGADDKATRADIVAVRKKMQAFKAEDTAAYEGMRVLEEDVADFRSNYEEAVYREEQFAAIKKQVEAFQKFLGKVEARIKQVERQKIAVDIALKETIREAKDIVKRAKTSATFEEAEDYQDQIIAVGARLNASVAELEQRARIPDVVRVMEKQIAEADRLVKTASSLVKRLDLGLDEAVQDIKVMVADMRGVLAAVKKGAVETDDLLGYIQENVSDKLDEVRGAVDEMRALDNIRQFVNAKNADVKRYESRLNKREKDGESVDEARVLLASLKEELKALKPLTSRRSTEETVDEALTLVRSIAEMSEQLEDELRLVPADALEQQLQKLFKNGNGTLGQFEFVATAR